MTDDSTPLPRSKFAKRSSKPSETTHHLGTERPDMPYTIENWSVRSDPWSAPARIRTSRIVAAQGRLVTTESGSVYLLGEADPAYVEFLKSIGRESDEANPVKVVE